MHIFAEQELSDLLRVQTQGLTEEVTNANRNYLLNVNETQYIDYLVGKWSVSPFELHFDALSVSDYERDIPVGQHPSFDYTAEPSALRRQHVFCYHLQISGNADLLRFRPSRFLMWSVEVSVGNGCIDFEIIDWQNKPGDVKREADGILSKVKTQAAQVSEEVAAFNASLPGITQPLLLKRKNQLLAQLNTLAALGVPIRRKDDIPATFAVPLQPSKPIVRPSAPSQAFAPEPTLEVQTYDSILKLIHDWGVEMERHPSIYSDKGEEALRDLFLMLLSPHFHSTTGETFNKSGKTDILVRYEGANVFVAECKFWRGIKVFHSTIDQLLGYLTWRDSKAAVICFVDNKELNPVLEQIGAETPKHPCLIKDFGKKDGGWFQYEFHLKGDSSRGVSLAVLCFHFPKAVEA